MLVLRRKVGERILVAGTITFKILAVEGERVKIGIKAPPGVKIVRSELMGRSGRQNAREKSFSIRLRLADETAQAISSARDHPLRALTKLLISAIIQREYDENPVCEEEPDGVWYSFSTNDPKQVILEQLRKEQIISTWQITPQETEAEEVVVSVRLSDALTRTLGSHEGGYADLMLVRTKDTLKQAFQLEEVNFVQKPDGSIWYTFTLPNKERFETNREVLSHLRSTNIVSIWTLRKKQRPAKKSRACSKPAIVPLMWTGIVKSDPASRVPLSEGRQRGAPTPTRSDPLPPLLLFFGRLTGSSFLLHTISHTATSPIAQILPQNDDLSPFLHDPTRAGRLSLPPKKSTNADFPTPCSGFTARNNMKGVTLCHAVHEKQLKWRFLKIA